MAQDTASGGLNQLEEHYKTFIVRPNLILLNSNAHGKTQTEQDFAQIAGAGLNYVRIPLPYWAIETWDGEAFLKQTAWKCVLTRSRYLFDSHSSPGIFSRLLAGRENMAYVSIWISTLFLVVKMAGTTPEGWALSTCSMVPWA
jgi:hypothetical protein